MVQLADLGLPATEVVLLAGRSEQTVLDELRAAGPALAAAPPRAKDASGSDYILIQTREPLTDDQRAKLESLVAGARLASQELF